MDLLTEIFVALFLREFVGQRGDQGGIDGEPTQSQVLRFIWKFFNGNGH